MKHILVSRFCIIIAGGPEPDKVMDIEELAALGQTQGFCPYYHARNVASNAELILMPYNYLLDAASRRSLRVAWPGSVVIFDEAHNLEGVASDSASFELTSFDIAASIAETQKCITHLRGEGGGRYLLYILLMVWNAWIEQC